MPSSTIRSHPPSQTPQESRVIIAKCNWNDTDVNLVGGVHYRVSITEREEDIADGDGFMQKKLCGLEGWDSLLLWPLCIFKRHPFERYFTLIGVVEGAPPQRILEYNPHDPEHTVFIAPATGRLYCYFNDWACLYGNNHGKFRLRFTVAP
jgi:hypothetical protein